MKALPAQKKVLVIYKLWESPNLQAKKTHEKSLKKIFQVLEKTQTSYQICQREKLQDTSQYSTLISLGGDGTFLHSAHFYQKGQILIGVNSAPESSYGAFCQLNAENFEVFWKAHLGGQLHFIPIQRLKIQVNRHSIPYYPLNDVLFSNPCPAGTSRYELKIGNKKEEHKSSGIWISTAKGSTGALHSAGGKTLNEQDEKFSFWVREAFQLQKKITLLNGTLKKKEKIILKNLLSTAHLYLDGSHLYLKLNYQDTVTLSLSNFPIFTLPKKTKIRSS